MARKPYKPSGKERFIEKMLAILVPLHPKAFFPKGCRDTKPLKLGIYEDILEMYPEFPRKRLRKFLHFYCDKSRYQWGLVNYSHRVDLNGEQAQEVTPIQRERAKHILAERKAELIARAEARKLARIGQQSNAA